MFIKVHPSYSDKPMLLNLDEIKCMIPCQRNAVDFGTEIVFRQRGFDPIVVTETIEYLEASLHFNDQLIGEE